MNDAPANGADQAQQQPPMLLNGQYIKDLSFESPNAPGILSNLQGAQPDVNINVDVSANKLEGGDDNLYEAVLEIKAEMKIEDKVGFIFELQYAGVFTLNVAEEHLSPMLLIECPRMLFPFARNIVAETTRDGGFMPLMLQPLDFAAMFQQNLQAQAGKLGDDVADLDAEVAKMAEEKSAN
ncbi:protein-export chaperone SecB [Pseudomonadota bacterium]